MPTLRLRSPHVRSPPGCHESVGERVVDVLFVPTSPFQVDFKLFRSTDTVRRMKLLLTAMLATGAGLAVVASAHAQAPQRTTATYEDWTVRCETPAASPAQKSCEMVQTTQMQGQAAPVTQIAIGRPLKTDPLRLVIGLPVNVWL